MNRKIKLLHLEDNISDAELIQIELVANMPNCFIKHVSSKSQFLQEIQSNQYEIIISDYNIPDMYGLESLHATKEVNPKIPFIYVSGAIGEERAVEMLKAGATDYVLKSNLDKLYIAIERALKEIDDAALVEQKEQEVRQSNAFKESILNALKTLIVVIDEDGTIAEVNQAWNELLYKEHTSQHSIGVNLLNLLKALHPENKLDVLHENVKNVINGSSLYCQQDLSITIHEVDYWFMTRVTPRLDKRGAVLTFSDITDHILSEKELLESKQKYRNLFENLKEAFVIADTDGVIKLANPAFYQLLEYSSDEEVIGKKESEVIQMVDNNIDLEGKLNDRLAGKSEDYETQILTSSGKRIWVNISASPQFDENKNFNGTLAIIRDITGKKVANIWKEITSNIAEVISSTNFTLNQLFDRILQEIQKFVPTENFYSALKSGEDEIEFIYLVDEYEQVKLPFKRKLGKGLSELVINSGKSILLNGNEVQQFHEENGLKIYGEMARSWMGTPIFKSGEVIGVLACQSYHDDNIFNDFDKQVLSYIASQIGIYIEKVDSNMKLMESERKYRGIFEGMHEGIILADPDGKITSVNPGFCKMIGYKESEILGKVGYEFLHPKEIGRQLRERIELRKKGIKGQYETEFLRKNGEVIWTDVSAQPTFNDNQELTGLILIIMDITERKNAELQSMELQQAFTKELKSQVAKRTRELENTKKELSLSLEKEKELGELKSRFVSTASHQFRTPLSVIQTSIGILAIQKDEMSDEFRAKFEKVYDRIKQQIEWMTDLMNEVLILGKINAGNITVQLKETDIVEVCEKLVQSYNIINSNKRTKIKINGTPSMISIDEKLLEHAMSNFISNAIKYSDDDTEVELKLNYSDEGLSIHIIDHGIGIPENELKHVFNPFFRASNARDINGTGLGTAIAKDYVELNGGQVTINSQQAIGTEVIITFTNKDHGENTAD